jgi:hypothetical protein
MALVGIGMESVYGIRIALYWELRKMVSGVE